MGNFCFKSNEKLKPTEFTPITYDEIMNIIHNNMKLVKNYKITCADNDYQCVSKKEMEEFLADDNTNKLDYQSESNDCDDFALALRGRVVEWYSRAKTKKAICFGMVHGDIRKSEEDDEFRPHAINYFIDENKTLWMIEPQNDKIFKLTSNSSIWFVYL